MRYEMKPVGVCSSKICFDLNGNVVTNVEFTNGCNGNLKAISKVIDGMTVEQIEGYFDMLQKHRGLHHILHAKALALQDRLDVGQGLVLWRMARYNLDSHVPEIMQLPVTK